MKAYPGALLCGWMVAAVARISGKRLRLATIELPENSTQGTADRGRVRRGDKTSNHVSGGEDEMERNIGRMLLGALLVGAGALVLGLLPGGVDTLWALKVGAFLGAGFGAIMSFGPGSARGSERERTGSNGTYRPKGR